MRPHYVGQNLSIVKGLHDMTAQELTKEVGEIRPALARVEEKVTTCLTRMDAVEKEQKEQGRLLVVVERLANGIENVRKDVNGLSCKFDEMTERVEGIEQKPAKRWDALVAQVIQLLIAAGVGYLLSKIIP